MDPERKIFSRRRVLTGLAIGGSVASALANFDSRRRLSKASNEIFEIKTDIEKVSTLVGETTTSVAQLESNQRILDEEAIEGVLANIHNLKSLRSEISEDKDRTENSIKIAKLERKFAFGALIVAVPAAIASAYYFVKEIRR